MIQHSMVGGGAYRRRKSHAFGQEMKEKVETTSLSEFSGSV